MLKEGDKRGERAERGANKEMRLRTELDFPRLSPEGHGGGVAVSGRRVEHADVCLTPPSKDQLARTPPDHFLAARRVLRRTEASAPAPQARLAPTSPEKTTIYPRPHLR